MSTATSILLVDDDDSFRRRLAQAFTRRGFEVRHTGDPNQALQWAREDSPELAVLDLRMPSLSGLELLRDLLLIDPTTRVVMLTGYGSIATAVDAIRLGAANYVAKPADADDVLSAFLKAEHDPLLAVEGSYEPLSLARVEWEHIHRVLSEAGGNISEAARRLGIHRRTLQRKLEKLPPAR
jgi:two-component system response regulator RegA